MANTTRVQRFLINLELAQWRDVAPVNPAYLSTLEGPFVRAYLFAFQFRPQANSIAARYGSPVYLVGGMLQPGRQGPVRDVDIRVPLSIRTINRLFGNPWDKDMLPQRKSQEWSDWEVMRAYDNLKTSVEMSRRYMKNIDFQTQGPGEWAMYQKGPRMRLDTLPDWLFTRAQGDK